MNWYCGKHTKIEQLKTTLLFFIHKTYFILKVLTIQLCLNKFQSMSFIKSKPHMLWKVLSFNKKIKINILNTEIIRTNLSLKEISFS